MAPSEFDQLVNDLQNGNEERLGQLFVEQYDEGILWLQRKYNCPKQDSEDVFMEAFYKFRSELLKGTVKNTNIKGYLRVIVKNLYLKRLRNANTYTTINIDIVANQLDTILNNNETFDLLQQKEERQAQSQLQHQEAIAFLEAWAKLGEKCKALLERFYVDGMKQKNIAKQLGLTQGSIRVKNLQCKRQLKKWFNKFLETNVQ